MGGSAPSPRPLTALLALCWWLALAGIAAAEVTVPDPGTFVVDEANVIDAGTRTRLEEYLRELEQKTGAQVKVLTIRTADGEDIVSFAQRHYELWKLGRKGKDDGALIILDVDERHVRIHTGYGLEGPLPDSYCGSLSRRIRDEFFRGGRYSDGLLNMAVSVANKVADDQGVKLTGVPDMRHDVPGVPPQAIVILLIVLIVFVFSVLSAVRRQHHRRMWRGDLTDVWFWGRVLGDVAANAASTWSSGSSSSGGGFGGGGGSFGGGGSSGGGGGGASW